MPPFGLSIPFDFCPSVVLLHSCLDSSHIPQYIIWALLRTSERKGGVCHTESHNSFHVEALFKMLSIESCPRGQPRSMNRPADHKKGGRQARLSQILDRASQKWTSSFHESPVPSWTPRCITTAMFLSQVWRRGWSVKGVWSPDDVMCSVVPSWQLRSPNMVPSKLVAHELAMSMGG